MKLAQSVKKKLIYFCLHLFLINQYSAREQRIKQHLKIKGGIFLDGSQFLSGGQLHNLKTTSLTEHGINQITKSAVFSLA